MLATLYILSIDSNSGFSNNLSHFFRQFIFFMKIEMSFSVLCHLEWVYSFYQLQLYGKQQASVNVLKKVLGLISFVSVVARLTKMHQSYFLEKVIFSNVKIVELIHLTHKVFLMVFLTMLWQGLLNETNKVNNPKNCYPHISV